MPVVVTLMRPPRRRRSTYHRANDALEKLGAFINRQKNQQCCG